MTTRFTVPTKQVADIAKKMGYRKHNTRIVVTDEVWLHNLNWDGGSKLEFTWICLDGLEGFKPDLGRPAPWNNKAENTRVKIEPGHIVVETGHFCGQTATMVIYVRPENMPAYLTAA